MTRGTPADPAAKRLNAREEAFITEYAKTGNRITAWQNAGYKGVKDGKLKGWASEALQAILLRPHVATALAKLKSDLVAQRVDAERFTLEWLRHEHMRLAALAEASGDITNATRNLEAVGRTQGAYTDNMSLDAGKLRAYTEAERLEARRLAGLLLAADASGARAELPIIDAETVAEPIPAVQDAPGSTISDAVGIDVPASDTPTDAGIRTTAIGSTEQARGLITLLDATKAMSDKDLADTASDNDSFVTLGDGGKGDEHEPDGTRQGDQGAAAAAPAWIEADAEEVGGNPQASPPSISNMPSQI